MRKWRNYTIGLEHETADRVELLTSTFGGSVGGFCKTWTQDLAQLNPEQLRKMRNIVHAWIAANKAEDTGSSA